MRIILACNLGMSTSMLIDKLIDEGKKRNLSLEVDAIPFDKVELYADKTDILLLGPQVRYLLSKMNTQFGEKITVIQAMNMSDYALLNAEKILNAALIEYEEKRK